MELSIVIPVFEESEKITTDIQSASQFLAVNNLTGEIIVVDDGSTDNTAQTAEAAQTALPTDIELKVIRNQHRGKGFAIRTGIIQSQGNYVMFADSGCCVPYDNVLRGLDLLKAGQCDIAHASRKLQGCNIIRKQTLYRRFCSWLLHRFLILYIRVPKELTDTQCGFKIYSGDIARRLYGSCITDGFMLDVEVILRALKQGYRIKEFPIQWTCDRDSRLSPTRSLRRVLSELRVLNKSLKTTPLNTSDRVPD